MYEVIITDAVNYGVYESFSAGVFDTYHQAEVKELLLNSMGTWNTKIVLKEDGVNNENSN